MYVKDFRELLEKTENKLSIFASAEILNKYEINKQECINLISEYLRDEEKLQLFNYSHFRQFENWAKIEIIKTISNENILLQIIKDDNITNGFESYEIMEIIKKVNDRGKQQILYNQDLIEKYQIADYDLTDIISGLAEESKVKILKDTNLLTEKLHLENFQIVELIKELSIDEEKIKIFEKYQLENDQIIDILKTIQAETLSKFLVEHIEFCYENELQPYEIIRELDLKQQKKFIENLENIDLSFNQKKEILATLKKEAKQSISTINIPEEYKVALSIETEEYDGLVILDLEKDLENYRGLDNLIIENPEEFTEQQRKKFIELCSICPNLQVASKYSDKVKYFSTGREYKEAEEWINSVINKIKPEYSNAQKIAIIDNEIGKKISYSPDFETEVYSKSDSRALWKIISSGYGVCNGIAKVEQYILKRIGIESEIISNDTDTHAFLKIKNIELPFANGEIVKGNTILDPTWNLASHKFSGKPDNFCISYEQARKNDIDIEKKDHKCHRNDEKLKDATINLDEQSLRQLFASVGLTDKDGNFPIKVLQEKSKQIDEIYANQPEQNLNNQFLLLSQTCPEFATCQNSSMSILDDILLNNENLKFDKCVVNRVYSRRDKEKRPILYVYINSKEIGKKFYFANKNEKSFTELSQEEFTKQFECYENDLKNMDGCRPWETKEQVKESIDLSSSSGGIVNERGR